MKAAGVVRRRIDTNLGSVATPRTIAFATLKRSRVEIGVAPDTMSRETDCKLGYPAALK
jgi:hypothetical protein